ncbi:hypothetical protein PG994_010474 [Apiospora phragmitis]|uniref:Methyltransferase domain-containing protein n=1 Tax=Apiospora phragmitis TaxID=2905665 RepID=A0ABR1TQ51_9PEZI
MEETAPRHGGGGGGGGVPGGGPTRKRSIVQNGRRFFSDPTLAYPFPIDLKETHRQTLSTLLRLRLNGGCPVLRSDELVGTGAGTTAASSSSSTSSSQQQQHHQSGFKPPRLVLEVGCGSGVWSMLCHRYFARHGRNAVTFVGLDIRGGAGSGGSSNGSTSKSSTSTSNSNGSSNNNNGSSSSGAGAGDNKSSGRGGKDEEDAAVGPPALAAEDRDDMNWRFVQHDCRQVPWPLESAAFDLVVFKDMSTAFTQKELAAVTDELVRVVRPGGVLEVWDVDSVLRSLKPNAPDTLLAAATTKKKESGSGGGGGGGGGSSSSSSNGRGGGGGIRHRHNTSQQQQIKQQQKDDAFAELGVYDVDANILGPSANPYIVEYNGWLSQACDARTVSPVPCATIGPFLVQEAETLEGMISKRFAIPLSTDIGWEKRHQQLCGGGSGTTSAAGTLLNSERAAIRNTALQCVVDLIGTWEPMLRSVNKMSQESWDAWYAKATKNLMLEGGADGGECLEVGVWSVRKKKNR